MRGGRKREIKEERKYDCLSLWNHMTIGIYSKQVMSALADDNNNKYSCVHNIITTYITLQYTT